MRRAIGIWLALAFLLLAGSACADALTITCQVGSYTGATIQTVDVNWEVYLFLPSCARTEPITINTDTDETLTIRSRAGQTPPLVSGEPFDCAALLADEPDDGKYSMIVQSENRKTERVNLMVSHWNPVSTHARIVVPDYEENYKILRSFIDQRTAWLGDEVIRWVTPVTIDTANIILFANYANAEETLLAVPDGKKQRSILSRPNLYACARGDGNGLRFMARQYCRHSGNRI